MLTLVLTLTTSLCPQDVPTAVAEICARSGGVATAERIGSSRGGRPIQVVTIADRTGTELAHRPAVLVVAGAHGEHGLGTELALHHAAALVDGSASAEIQRLLSTRVIYIVPQLNPDGAVLGRPGNARAIDLDRDGREDEDGPDDLDGDGAIAQMRWPDPEGEWIVDPDAPRLLRKADRDAGERGTHRIAAEARDDDGDEERGEDPAEGALVHRGFAHDFPEFDRRAGLLALGEPECRALADFVFAHRHIAIAFVYGPEDNLLAKPKIDPGKGRKRLTGVLEGDRVLYESVGERYRELTGRKGAVRDRHDGSVWSWLYFHVGVPTFATDVWRVPDKVETKSEDGGKDKDKGKGKKKPNPDAARLAHCEAVGFGFVPWKKLTHPELGEVEVGGFVSGLDWRLMPQAERSDTYAKHHEFVLEIVGWLPSCGIEKLESKELKSGVYELEAAVVNTGRMPALTAMSERCRRFHPPRLTLDTGGAALAAGQARHRARNLKGSGDRQTFKWIVTGDAGTTVRLEMVSDFSGRGTAEVKL